MLRWISRDCSLSFLDYWRGCELKVEYFVRRHHRGRKCAQASPCFVATKWKMISRTHEPGRSSGLLTDVLVMVKHEVQIDGELIHGFGEVHHGAVSPL